MTALLKVFIFFFVSITITSNTFGQRSVARLIDLRCEHLVNPIGIDSNSPRFSWRMVDDRIGAGQTAYRIQLAPDSLALTNGQVLWDTQWIQSDKNLIAYAGESLKPFTKYFWQVTIADHSGAFSSPVAATFETGMMNSINWRGAWISDGTNIETKAAPYFRKEAKFTKAIKSARAYIAVAGLYELSINGRKVGNHRLDPMYTRFDKRTLYVTHDITGLLKSGINAFGVVLGNGWYNHQSTAVWGFHHATWRNRPSFCMDVRITYEDGSVETIVTDKTWKTSHGSIVFNSIYTGDHQDLRKEQIGWNEPGFNDGNWKSVVYRQAPSGNITAQVMEPIRSVEKFDVKKINRLNDSTYVFDFGRNFSGITTFTIDAKAGTVFKLQHGERLYPNGHIDMSNIDEHYRPTGSDDPFQTDIYTTREGKQTFEPKFNYKGFQYVEITCNQPVTLTKENLTGYFMHSDVHPIGRISTSNPVMNSIWSATNNSYLSNLFGYPTDCPQREKNGWTGDAHIASETGLYNFDAITVYEKWLADHRDEQQPNGVLPSIIPTHGWGYEWGNGPDWTSSIAIIPWNLYLFYGDEKALRDSYQNIKRYVDHITEISPSGLTSWGLGDWVPVKSKAPVELTSTCYYYADVMILAKAAKLFGKTEDYKFYSELANKIKRAFNEKYFYPATNLYGDGHQTELSVPLFWGLVPHEVKASVAANLARQVEADNFHLDVGLLGQKAILNALSENGYGLTAYRIAAQETYPSWGWWIKNGATTLYENWNIDATRDLSLNHIMFGEIGAWMFKGIGGIYPDENGAGFKNILLKPNFVTDSFEATHDSPYGTIVSSWTRTKGRLQYTAVIPPNASATFYVPEVKGMKLYYQGKVQAGKQLTLEAGSHTFTWK
ncbi:MAG: family 78 glycoside hydrolase catalytic domain [Cyclobacteriaceae bacterium]